MWQGSVISGCFEGGREKGEREGVREGRIERKDKRGGRIMIARERGRQKKERD